MAKNSSSNNGQGFQNMDPKKQRAIASEGGKASSGSFTKGSQRAKQAGAKGGASSHRGKSE